MSDPTTPFDPSAPTEQSVIAEGEGATIGRYKLLQVIGEGGFGVVYMAEQTEPVSRRVALKIIKLGMDTKQVIARFEAERQALALMDHPNIAKVLDAGATETGRPFFVMELVKGVPITKYCDDSKLSTEERLRLFLDVCNAIQHAHQKGIIHRDIKPSNILVTLHDGKPVPKVIDFGIAKATQSRLTEKTLFTRYEQMIGTPAYMSPEQAEMSGLDIDTRSDIYSLGVLLYELLTGSTPFDSTQLLSAGLDEMRRIIREQEPVRPSTRVSTLAAAKGGAASSPSHARQHLAKLLRADLDWIVLKCLEKERARRYETANGLAMDIRRYLANELVTARPPSAAYRLRKFASRNKAAFSAASIVLISLLVTVVLSSASAFRATRAEKREKQLRAEAQNSELEARRRAYASDMILTQLAIQQNNVGRALALLDQYHPNSTNELDLRGWEWRYLWQLCKSDELFTVSKFPAFAKSVAYSPDGKFLASAAAEQEATIFDLQSRRLVKAFSHGSLGWVGFSPSGSLLAYADTAGVRLIDLATLREHALIKTTESDPPVVFAFSPSGKEIAIGVNEHIEIWQIDGAIALQKKWRAHNAHLHRIDWASDELLATLSLSDGVIVWSRDGTRMQHLPGGGSLAFARTRPLLLIGGLGTVTFVDTRSWQIIDTVGSRATNNFNLFFDIRFSSDERRFVTASGDHTLLVWDTASRRTETTLRGHENEVFCAAFSPDNRTIASASKDQTIRIWPIAPQRPQQPRFTIPPNTYAVFSPRGESFIVRSNQSVTIYDTRTFARRSDFVFQHEVSSLALTDSGELIATASPDGVLRLCDVSKNAVTREFQPETNAVAWVRLSQDARFLAALNSNHELAVFRVADAERIWSEPRLLGARFSPDNAFFVTSGHRSDSVKVVSLASGQIVSNLRGHISSVTDAILSPLSRFVATESWDGTACLWDSSSGRRIASLRSWLQSPAGLAFTPDEARLAVGALKNIKLFDLKSSKEVLVLTLAQDAEKFFFLDQNLLIVLSGGEIIHFNAPPLSLAD